MKKLIPVIFALLFSTANAQISVYVSGDCQASDGITWTDMLSGNYEYSGDYNGMNLHTKVFAYQGDEFHFSIRYDNTKWVLQGDESSEALFQNTTVSGAFPPLEGWVPAVDLSQEGCTADIYMAILLSTDEMMLNTRSAQIFPNPVSDRLQLLNAQNGSYIISDLAGKIVQSGTVKAGETIFTGDLSKGNYLFTVTGEDQKVSVQQFIKK